MKYVDFLEKVRRHTSRFIEVLEDLRAGKDSEENADNTLHNLCKELAKVLKEFEDNREEESKFLHLCPVCNTVAHEEGGASFVKRPGSVGQCMVFEKDIWQSYEGYRCPLCGYRNFHKIEHWE